MGTRITTVSYAAVTCARKTESSRGLTHLRALVVRSPSAHNSMRMDQTRKRKDYSQWIGDDVRLTGRPQKSQTIAVACRLPADSAAAVDYSNDAVRFWIRSDR